MIEQGLEAGEEFADGAMMKEVGVIVERGRVAVDDGEERATAFGDHRESCRRLHLQG